MCQKLFVLNALYTQLVNFSLSFPLFHVTLFLFLPLLFTSTHAKYNAWFAVKFNTALLGCMTLSTVQQAVLTRVIACIGCIAVCCSFHNTI